MKEFPVIIMSAKTSVEDKVLSYLAELQTILQNPSIQRNCWQESPSLCA